MEGNDTRTEFLTNVRRALGRDQPIESLTFPEANGLSNDQNDVTERVEVIRADVASRSEELVQQLLNSAEELGWVVRQATPTDAVDHVREVVEGLGASVILRSDHTVLDEIDIEGAVEGSSIQMKTISYDLSGEGRAAQRAEFRQDMIGADVGITGVDFAIAETGSAVIMARKGVSRLISLLPPLHIAVVKPDQILPSLDELFTMRRFELLQTGSLPYANIISGPSRSADIEQTLIKGMHGPREVYMIVLT